MQKIIQFLRLLGYMPIIVLYPIISFIWYRFCRIKNDSDAKKFVQYGVFGLVGILGMMTVGFRPFICKFDVKHPMFNSITQEYGGEYGGVASVLIYVTL